MPICSRTWFQRQKYSVKLRSTKKRNTQAWVELDTEMTPESDQNHISSSNSLILNSLFLFIDMPLCGLQGLCLEKRKRQKTITRYFHILQKQLQTLVQIFNIIFVYVLLSYENFKYLYYFCNKCFCVINTFVLSLRKCNVDYKVHAWSHRCAATYIFATFQCEHAKRNKAVVIFSNLSAV
jgi:hypothetical protein